MLADDDGQVLGVVCDAGEIRTEQVIVATGVATPEVLAGLIGHPAFATQFPMQRSPGFLLTTPSLLAGQKVQRVVYPPDPAGLHLRPAANGGMLLAADDTDGMLSEDTSARMIQKATAELLDRTQRLIPEFPGRTIAGQCSSVIGYRAVPADDRPIAGPILGARGLTIALPHSGITLAPALAELIAELIETGHVTEQLAAYSLDRF